MNNYIDRTLNQNVEKKMSIKSLSFIFFPNRGNLHLLTKILWTCLLLISRLAFHFTSLYCNIYYIWPVKQVMRDPIEKQNKKMRECIDPLLEINQLWLTNFYYILTVLYWKFVTEKLRHDRSQILLSIFPPSLVVCISTRWSCQIEQIC